MTAVRMSGQGERDPAFEGFGEEHRIMAQQNEGSSARLAHRPIEIGSTRPRIIHGGDGEGVSSADDPPRIVAEHVEPPALEGIDQPIDISPIIMISQ